MDRNWNLIREILLKLKEMPPEKGNLLLEDFPSDKAHEYSYHVELLMDAGLIKGRLSDEIYGTAPQDFWISGMTWEAHELLDSIQNDTIWKKVKNRFSKEGVAMTFALVKLVALEQVKETLGMK